MILAPKSFFHGLMSSTTALENAELLSPPRLHTDRLQEYGGLMQARDKLLSNDAHAGTNHPASGVPLRWQYYIFIDQDCLRSLEKEPVDPELKDPALRILTTD
jgi:hypothetical protein